MSRDILLKLPADTDLSVSKNPESLYAQLTARGCVWPAFPAIGTRVENGIALLLIRVPRGVTKTVFTKLFASAEVVAIKDARATVAVDINDKETREFKVEQAPDRAKLVDHFPDKITHKKGGSIDTVSRPAPADKLYIGTYLGSEPIEI